MDKDIKGGIAAAAIFLFYIILFTLSVSFGVIRYAPGKPDVLILCVGVVVFMTAITEMVTGIPFMRTVWSEFRREREPVIFWIFETVSLGVGLLLILFGFGTITVLP